MSPEIIILLVLSGSLNVIFGTILCFKLTTEHQQQRDIPIATIVSIPQNNIIPNARPLPSPTNSLDSLTI